MTVQLNDVTDTAPPAHRGASVGWNGEVPRRTVFAGGKDEDFSVWHAPACQSVIRAFVRWDPRGAMPLE